MTNNDTSTPALLSAIESIAAEMARLTADLPTRFEIRNNHLRVITPNNPEGHRQGRNFSIYAQMARDTNPSVAVTDFAGVILRFYELFPTKFDKLRPQILALAPLMNYADEADHWVKIWQ